MTIYERAREWCNSIINRLDTSDLYRGYVQGAVEERTEFKEYLEKRRNKVAEIDTKDYEGWEMYYMADITEIINELFKED